MIQNVRRVQFAVLPGGTLAEQDDVTLARALIAGDPSASRVAWDRFAPMVHRILKRTLGPGTEVEDLAQDVFLCLFRKARTLREPKVLKAFVISITALTARAELRRRRARRWLHLDTDIVAPVHPDPEARQALVRFYEILDSLAAEDRTAFVLRFMEDMELTDVAAALDVSLSTTKRKLARVWKRISILVQRDPALAHYLASLEKREEAS
jgi:RNA polymerase sigma-70 factor (ECF subfamily)